MNEEKYKIIYDYLDTSLYPKNFNDRQKRNLVEKSTNYFIQQRQLFKKNNEGNPQRIILPDQTELILFNLHKDQSGAHLGTDATYEKLKERYYWPKMYDSVKRYIKTCDNCQKRGKPNRKESIIPIKVGKPFHRIGIDIKGPLSITTKGNRYIIVAMDYLTKWPEAKAIPNMKAETVAEFLYKEIFCRHGIPEEILSDRGTSFINEVIKELCLKFQTKHRLTTAYRPQTNGMIERFNKTIGECIAKLLSDHEKEWDDYVESVLFAYRTMKHEVTKFTPFQLLYGRQAKLPIEFKVVSFKEPEMTYEEALIQRINTIVDKMYGEQDQALNNIEKSQEKIKSRQKRKSDKLKEGDKVLVHRTDLQNNMSAKLQEKWIGPYFIHKVFDNNIYKLRNMNGKLVKNLINGNRLKIYYEEELKPMVLID